MGVKLHVRAAMICFVQKRNWFVVMLVATYSETDSAKFKDASFVETLFVTYSEIDSVKFKDASFVETLVVTYSEIDSAKFKDASFVETLFVTYSEIAYNLKMQVVSKRCL